MSTAQWPDVGVVIPTCNRPELVRQSLAAILAQDYPGDIEVIVVFDGEEPDHSLASHPEEAGSRRVRVMRNTRTPGLAGARNTGICSATGDLIAFCDDDDCWSPGKLTAQVSLLRRYPEADMVTCAIQVSFAGTLTARLAGTEEIHHHDLLRSRLAMLHSSTFVLRARSLREGIGLLDESIPGSQNEDWDLLLRASRRQPIPHVDEPLVCILWGQSSYYSRQWETRVASLLWMLDRYPDIRVSRIGAARVYGQLAFGYAVLGRRRESLQWAARSLARRWREPRGVIALAVAARFLPAEFILSTLHRRGRGI